MRLRHVLTTAALGSALALGSMTVPAQAASVSPAQASPTASTAAAACSMWTDYRYGHGRGLRYCPGSGRDVQVTVKCGDPADPIRRTNSGYEGAVADCPSGLGAIGVSGKYI